MGKKILSVAWRYGVPLVAFVLILLLSMTSQRFLPFGLDLTLLMILLLIATAWYIGRGPGLLVAVVFEATLSYFTTLKEPYSFKSAAITVNRLALFVSIVLFAGARRNAERRLREQHEVLQVTLASIGDAVMATDIDGKINFINPTAEALTGWTKAEAAGKFLGEIFQIINEDTRANVKSPFDAVIEKGAVVGLANHTILIAKDGAEIPVEDSGAPIRDTDGRIIGVIVVFHDVSERRRVEKERERLLQSEQAARAEAETAGRLKDEFLATVSHELRTPLSAILGWAAMLRTGKMDEATLRNALGVIERNARAQADIIDDILDVSRIITGKLHIDSNPVEMTQIIRLAVEALRPAALAKSINLETSLDAGEAPVIGDSDRLQQVVWNLAANAIKFTPAGGSVEVALEQTDAHVEIKVSDNGAGISEEFLPFVFERFRQNDASTTRAHGGLGLGLAIVRHLVEMHGGTVTAHSEGTDKGAVFTVRLPLADRRAPIAAATNELAQELPAPPEIFQPAPDLNGLRVLVVDDDADTLEMLDLVLNRYGANVKTAASSAAALEIFRRWKPDVLISDLGMPGEDGFTFIAKIRALSPAEGGDVPAAALTAYAAEKDRHEALAAGYQIHIPKPIDPATLAAKVAEMGKKEDGRQ
jgi:PAS domain S-box-containing protein